MFIIIDYESDEDFVQNSARGPPARIVRHSPGVLPGADEFLILLFKNSKSAGSLY